MSIQTGFQSSKGSRRGYSSCSAIGGGGGGRRTYSCRGFGGGGGGGCGMRGQYGSRSLHNYGGGTRISYGRGYGGGMYGGYGGGYGSGAGGMGGGFGSGMSGGYGGGGMGGYGGGGMGGFGGGGMGGGFGPGGISGGFGPGGIGGGFGGGGMGGGFGPGGLSCGPGGIGSVQIDPSLLRPVNVEIDPQIQQVKNQEKEQIKGLNNQFATFIDKVRFLEQQNKVLKTKWQILQQQTQGRGPMQNLDGEFQQFMNNLRNQIEQVRSQKQQMTSELQNMQQVVEDSKNKYEQEINHRTSSENEFVMLKKDVDNVYMCKADLEAKVGATVQELNFLHRMFDLELSQIHVGGKDTSVVVNMDDGCDLNLEGLIDEVRAGYEEVARSSRAEAETWYRSQYEALQNSAGRHGENLQHTKQEIQELTRNIQRLCTEIEHAKKQCAQLQACITEAEDRGEMALRDAKQKLEELEKARCNGKEELARLMKEYQCLMNTKLALDMEIAMYRKMLEGEEGRLSGLGSQVHVSARGSSYGGGIGGSGGLGGLGGGLGGGMGGGGLGMGGGSLGGGSYGGGGMGGSIGGGGMGGGLSGGYGSGSIGYGGGSIGYGGGSGGYGGGSGGYGGIASSGGSGGSSYGGGGYSRGSGSGSSTIIRRTTTSSSSVKGGGH